MLLEAAWWPSKSMEDSLCSNLQTAYNVICLNTPSAKSSLYKSFHAASGRSKPEKIVSRTHQWGDELSEKKNIQTREITIRSQRITGINRARNVSVEKQTEYKTRGTCNIFTLVARTAGQVLNSQSGRASYANRTPLLLWDPNGCYCSYLKDFYYYFATMSGRKLGTAKEILDAKLDFHMQLNRNTEHPNGKNQSPGDMKHRSS